MVEFDPDPLLEKIGEENINMDFKKDFYINIILTAMARIEYIHGELEAINRKLSNPDLDEENIKKFISLFEHFGDLKKIKKINGKPIFDRWEVPKEKKDKIYFWITDYFLNLFINHQNLLPESLQNEKEEINKNITSIRTEYEKKISVIENDDDLGGGARFIRKSRKSRRVVRKSRKSRRSVRKSRRVVRKSRKSRRSVRKSRKSRRVVRKSRKSRRVVRKSRRNRKNSRK